MHQRILVLVVVLVAVTTTMSAQLQDAASAAGYNPQSAFFSFGGRLQLFGEYANQSGSFTDRQPRYAYGEFTPTFSVFGVPFSASFLYSTDDQNFRQRINSANLSINPAVLQNYILARAQEKAEKYTAEQLGSVDQARDSLEKYRAELEKANPERLKELEQMVRMDEIRRMNPRDLAGRKDLLEQAGLLSSYEKAMMYLPRVGVGTNYPNYSELTLNGIAINGVDVEWNPGRFYMAFTTGHVLNPIPQFHPYDPLKIIDTAVTTAPVYSRNMTSVRLGVGSRSESYFILTGMKFKDDPGSVKLQNDTVSVASSPQENIVLAAEGNASMWDGRLSFNSEFAISLFTSDVTSSEVDLGSDSTSTILKFFNSQVDVKVTSFWDWAVLGGMKLNIPESSTRFSAVARRIGTGYRSLGLLNQRTDYMRYDVRIDQALFNRVLSLGLFARHDQDNLIAWKRATTDINAYGMSVGINPRGLPYLRIMYSPYYQRNDAGVDTFKVDNTTTLLSGTLGYAYRAFDLSHSTNLSYTSNAIRTFQQRTDFDIESIYLGHSTSFTFPLTVSVAVGRVSQSSSSALLGLPTLRVFNAELSASYTAWDVWNFNGGVSLADEDSNGTRSGYFLALNVPLGGFATFDIRAEKNVFKTTTQVGLEQYLRPYDETVIRATISKYW